MENLLQHPMISCHDDVTRVFQYLLEIFSIFLTLRSESKHLQEDS